MTLIPGTNKRFKLPKTISLRSIVAQRKRMDRETCDYWRVLLKKILNGKSVDISTPQKLASIISITAKQVQRDEEATGWGRTPLDSNRLHVAGLFSDLFRVFLEAPVVQLDPYMSDDYEMSRHQLLSFCKALFKASEAK